VSFESTFPFAAIAAELALLVLLSLRGMWRVVPMFCIYIGWSLISDVLAMLFQSYETSANYFRFWLMASEANNIVGFLVLLEIILAVWRRHNSPRKLRDEALLAVSLAAAGLALWPIAERLTPQHLSHDTALVFGFQQVLCLMFIACGAVLVILRRRISLNWTDLEFQIAVGISFVSGFSLVTGMLRLTSEGKIFPRLIDQISGVSYLVTLIFWIRCFFRTRRLADDSGRTE
jgi:hypothetical protein